MATVTHTRVHTYVTFSNPYLVCDQCEQSVPNWHNPDRCGCGQDGWENQPCGHTAGITGTCFTWDPVDGCACIQPELHEIPRRSWGR